MNKYKRKLSVVSLDGKDVYQVEVDVYSVLEAFGVACPARQHAIKKLLCAGTRGKGDTLQDLMEASQSVSRAIDLEYDRIALAEINAAPKEEKPQ